MSFETCASADASSLPSGDYHAAMQLLCSPEIPTDPFFNDAWQPDVNFDPSSWFSIPDEQASSGGSPWPAAVSQAQGLVSMSTMAPTQQTPDLLRICR